jgi:ADP-heptose:LPS heptosyltransferase
MIPPEADVRHLSALSLPLWRELRNEDFDAAIVYFSGEPGFFKLKVLPFLLGIRDVLVINEHSNHFLAGPRTLARFFFQRLAHGSFQPVQKKLVLWIQTEIPEYTALAVKKLVKQDLLPDCEIALFCREEDRPQLQNLPQVGQVISFSRGNRRHNFRSWQKLRKLYPDVVASLFSGRPIFRKQKLLFFLFLDHPQLVFNAGLDCYWLKPWTLPRLLRNDALLLEDPKAEGPRVLMVQTESERYIQEAIRRVTRDRLYPHAKIAVLCREADRSTFEKLPAVSHVFTFDRKKHKGLLKTLGKVRKFSPEIISAVFSGRNVFWKQKLLFLLYFRKPRLTFNARLDAYWMSLRTFARIFRQEPLLFEDTSHRAEVLLIQSESDSVTRQAMQAMVSGKAVAGNRLAIFCSEEKQPFFEQFSAIERFYTYKPGQILSNLGSLKQLLRRDRDVVSAVFTGRPVYRMQKLLFFLLPARNRLVFNENLDCFYLRRGRWSRSLGLPSFLRLLHVHQQSVPAAGPSLQRQILKAVLFLPRFLYLLAWTAVMKLKRSYRQARSPRTD